MKCRAASWLWGVVVAAVAAGGLSCERGTGAGLVASTQPAGETNWASSVELVPMTPLLPRLATHFTLDTRGNVYWIQESEGQLPAGGDFVFAMGESGVPQTVPELTAARILAAAGHPKGSGAIRSMAVGPDDNLYVYFTGGDGREVLALVVRYEPRARRVSVVADTGRIRAESGLGDSIELARGTLVSNGSELWVWLRSELLGASSAVVKLTPSGAGAVELRRLLVKSNDPSTAKTPLVLDSEREDLSVGPKGRLYYLDRRRACLWRIDASGVATRLQSVEGLSQAVTAPVVDDDGNLTMLAGDSEAMFAREGAGTPADWARLLYPALVRMEPGGKVRTIGAKDVHGPSNLPLNTMQPRGLVADRAHGGWVTFDAGSGELLGVRLGKE